MSATDTFVFRASLQGRKSTYRDIEIESARSLYALAKAIVASFNFDFDHAFGFYAGLTSAKFYKEFPKYELFADMGDAEPGVLGVKKTRISHAFRTIGHTMMFLFDYGDEWLFRVALRATRSKIAKVRYPRIVAVRGEAPAQYPDPDGDNVEDTPRYGINVATGEIIKIG